MAVAVLVIRILTRLVRRLLRPRLGFLSRLLRRILLRLDISVVEFFGEFERLRHRIEGIDTREVGAFRIREGHITVRANLVLDVDTVNERVGRDVLAGDFLKQRTVRGEVRVSATEAAAQPGILFFHQTFNARILKYVEVGMQSVKVPALLKDGNRCRAAGILRVTDFVSNEEVILVNRHAVKLRQHKHAIDNIEQGSRRRLVTDCDVLTCQQLRETALGLIEVRQIVANRNRLAVNGGSCFLNVHKLIISNGAECVKAGVPVSPLE